jgi:hypothetical protein
LDVAESDGDVLDVYFGGVIGVAEFFAEFVVEVFAVDDAVLPRPPLEELHVFLEFSEVVEVNSVLFDLLAVEVSDEEAVLAVVCLLACPARLFLPPVLSLQARGLVGQRLLASH